MISAEERDLLRCRVWIHTSRLDRIWLEISPGPTYSDQEVQQIREEMLPLRDGLGERKTVDEESITLRTSPDLLRRVFEFMLHMAGGEGAEDDRGQATEDLREYEDRHVRGMCRRVLAQLDGASATTGGSADG